MEVARSAWGFAFGRLVGALAAAPAKGLAIEVSWGGEWWRGVAGTTRWSAADSAVVTRVAYAAADGWKATASWHAADEMEWRAAQ